MNVGDTSLGGSRSDFPETVLDVVRKAADGAPDEFCRRYWKPVYHYFRVSWARSNEDAKDLAQAFFLWLSDPRVLKRYDPARAGFRTYLKSLLRHFVQHHDEALGRLKRGGGKIALPLDADVALQAPDRAPGPPDAFDADWRRGLLDDAVEAVRDRLQGPKVRVFEEYYLGGERPTYAALAARHGMSEHEVQHALREVRAEVRERIRARMAETASDKRELEEEWNAFLG